jgi:hypothetical protein
MGGSLHPISRTQHLTKRGSHGDIESARAATLRGEWQAVLAYKWPVCSRRRSRRRASGLGRAPVASGRSRTRSAPELRYRLRHSRCGRRVEEMSATVAALFVERGGAYWNLPGVDPWDEARDARLYAGPHPVVAHPPCERWAEQWHACRPVGHPSRGALGDDNGCFESTLRKVRQLGGVLEHPANSRAWKVFGLPMPVAVGGGWVRELFPEIHAAGVGYSAHVEQGHYGHALAKPTWLYFVGHDWPPPLRWGASGRPKMDRRPSRRRQGEEARALCDRGGERSATPPAFRDLLLSVARGSRVTPETP